MEKTSRRTLLRRLSTIPATLALGQVACKRSIRDGKSAGYLNLYLKGPFSLVFHQGQTNIHIISPSPKDHHEPSLTSLMDETLIYPLYDYELVGLSPAGQTTWTSNKRLNIPASTLGLDKGGVIDRTNQRYFSLLVPYPDTIVPWHPAEMTITGGQWPKGQKLTVSVGYIFIYYNVDLSAVKVTCMVNGQPYVWDPRLAPLAGEPSADLLLEMSSRLDSDPCHTGAKGGFMGQVSLFQNVNDGQSLDLSVKYLDDPACCRIDTTTCSQKDAAAKRHGPFTTFNDRGHTGADCKAGIIDITGVSSSVKIGS